MVDRARRWWCAPVLAGCALLAGAPAARAEVADTFGYVARHSTDGGLPYDYVEDFSATSLTLGDEDFATVPLPFPFTFYGVTYSTVEVQSNGQLTFGLGEAAGYQHDCGNLATPDAPTIWAYFVDIAPQQVVSFGGGVYHWTQGEEGRRVFGVEWFKLPVYDVAGDLIFEVKLFEEDSRIELHFRDVRNSSSLYDDGRKALIGLSDGDEHTLVFACDTESVHASEAVTLCVDGDGDGWCAYADCDDEDDRVGPEAEEVCDGVDTDCDGLVPTDEADADGDEVAVCEGDCDDFDATVHPDATEICNGEDDNCDGVVPEDEQDLDEDGESLCRGDCDDDDPTLNLADEDGDSYTSCGGDCDDGDPLILPGTPEFCGDEVDNDCDGIVDNPADCAGGDDDDDDLGDLVPYGCLLGCAAEGRGGSSALALLPALAAVALRRRRKGAAA